MRLAFTLSILAAGCSLSTVAFAQAAASSAAIGSDVQTSDAAAQSDAGQLGSPLSSDIVVTGVRASLERAQTIKRRADVISDSISAEDIGKFPDANVADALQRVTGVQISRDTGGEGRFISIRGLGSQFNLTTFNGRVLATDNAGRDFSYDVLPSEALASATVYKTPSAAQTEGSIGGLVELTTLNPLSKPGLHISATAAGYLDQSTNDVTPRAGAVVSDTFLNNTLGVFGGVYYYKRDWRSDTFESFSRSTEAYDATGNGFFSSAQNPEVGRAAFPGDIAYQIKEGSRERLSFISGVQWEPSDRLKVKLDGFYSRYNTPETHYGYYVNFYSNNGWARWSNATLVPWAGPGDNNKLITQFTDTNIPYEVGTDSKYRKTDLYEAGLNTSWQPTDRLTAIVDVAYSQSNSPNKGQDFFTVAGIAGATYTYTAVDPVPSVTCTLSSGSSCYAATEGQLGLHFMEQKGESVKDKVFSSRVDFTYDAGRFGGLDVALRFGGNYSNRNKNRDYYYPTNACGYCGYNDLISATGVDVSTAFPSGGYRAGSVGTNNTWIAIDAQKLFQAAIADKGQAYFDSTIAPQLQQRQQRYIHEQIYGGYLELAVNSARFDGNIGLRYAGTKDVSSGYTQQLLGITPIPGTTNYIGSYSDVVPVSDGNEYHNWLPSLNVTYKFQPNLYLRGALSKTVTRPTFSQLGVDVDYQINNLPLQLNRSGNPYLRAIKADSADLSLEWYGKHGTAASVAGFYKSIDGFITNANLTQQIDGYAFQVNSPVNGDKAHLAGVEVAVQHTLPMGLGAQVNYTFVYNDANVTVNGVQVGTKLDGVSKHTVNVSGFYEKGPISARLSFNVRGRYVAAGIGGPASTPEITDTQKFLDFSGTYKLTKNFSLYANLYNLTQEGVHTYFLDKRFTAYSETYPRRFEIGARAEF